jgi:hypothetical protein
MDRINSILNKEELPQQLKESIAERAIKLTVVIITHIIV